jgi:hypothetical protein
MKEVFENVFKDLNIPFQHFYGITKQLNVKESLVIFFMVPEMFESAKVFVNKNDNKFVLWNIEPCNVGEGKGEGEKFIKRRDLLNKILETEPALDCMWVYHAKQKKYFNNSKCLYLPIGFHECMMPKNISQKENGKPTVFLGHMTPYRKSFINAARKGVPIEILSHDKFGINKGFKSYLSEFRLGLDLRSRAYLDEPNWHRIMIYAACGIATITQNNLSIYGFIDGIHYAGIKEVKDFIEKARAGLKNKKGHAILAKMASAMLEKVRSDYHMTNLMKDAISKI